MNMSKPVSAHLKQVIQKTFDQALEVQYPLAIANVERLRRVNPDMSPRELIKHINKYYLASIAVTGVGAGATAAVPNGVVQTPAAIADMAANMEASIFYALSVMEVYGISVEDIERRRLLVFSVMLGGSASANVIGNFVPRLAPHWGKMAAKSVPLNAIRAANKVLGRNFITRYGTKQGIIVLGKQAPLMVGAAVGGLANCGMGYFVIRSAESIFGKPPAEWPMNTLSCEA